MGAESKLAMRQHAVDEAAEKARKSREARSDSASAVLEYLDSLNEDGVKLTVTRQGVAERTEQWNEARPDGMVAARVADVIELIEEIGDEFFGISVDPENLAEAVDPNEALIAQASGKILGIIKSKSGTGRSALEIFQGSRRPIFKAVKTLKPSGAMLSAEKIWEKMLEELPTLAQNPATKEAFLAAFQA